MTALHYTQKHTRGRDLNQEVKRREFSWYGEMLQKVQKEPKNKSSSEKAALTF